MDKLLEQLMNETLAASNQDAKVRLAPLERKAREFLGVVRERLEADN